MAQPDPVRATFVAILGQLNRAEVRNEGEAPDQSLELPEIERRLADFWAVKNGQVRVPFALGLLLKNRFVQATPGGKEYSWQRQRLSVMRYQITSSGKEFLVDAIQTSDRIR